MKIIFVYLVFFSQIVMAKPLECAQKTFLDQNNQLNVDQMVVLFSEVGPDCAPPIECYKKAENAFKSCDSKKPNDVRAYLCSGTTTPDKTIECFENTKNIAASFTCVQRAIICHHARNMAPIRCVKDTIADKIIPAITNENIAILCSGSN